MKPVLAACLALTVALPLSAANATSNAATPNDETGHYFQPTATTARGSVTVHGRTIDYTAVTGTLVVHAKGWDDTAKLDAATDKKKKHAKAPAAEAAMSYVAYFKRGVPAAKRPITFIFNGGPGSATLWLHMGAFGPVRVVTHDHSHTPAAPYSIVNNDQSLLDASDLVFIDAPGLGFGRIAGKDKKKAFYGVDQDIHAFAVFIREFLSTHSRWNSPKYVFGESYGTMRAAGLSYALQKEDIDLNGVMMLSDILNWDLIPDDPELNPAMDLPYVVALPTYAATAWYHHKIANRPADLKAFLKEVQHFATTDYTDALMRGNNLPDAQRQAIAAKLHDFTGLPVAYLLRSNLRIEYGAFQKELLADQDQTTGTLDTRFTGPTLDPLSKIAAYDPQGSAISSAYISAFHRYVETKLHYHSKYSFKPGIPIYGSWDYRHQPPGASKPMIALPNVLPDLATAMKRNPAMKVMINGGYFDVSTPYFSGWYEMHHLQIPKSLQKNVEYHYYQSGHMVYVHLPTLKELHDNVAGFIRRTDNLK